MVAKIDLSLTLVKPFVFCAALVYTTFPLHAQDTLKNKYGLYVITSTKELQKTIDADSNKAFVHLKKYVPEIVLDMKYATRQNLMYTKMYDKASDMIRLPVAKALDSAQREFKKYGYGIKVYDSYRPYSVTCYMYKRIPDSNYLAKPWRGSRHNRGITVDMTLIDFVKYATRLQK